MGKTHCERIAQRCQGAKVQRSPWCKGEEGHLGAKVRCMEDYIQPTLRETLVMLYSMSVQMT